MILLREEPKRGPIKRQHATKGRDLESYILKNERVPWTCILSMLEGLYIEQHPCCLSDYLWPVLSLPSKPTTPQRRDPESYISKNKWNRVYAPLSWLQNAYILTYFDVQVLQTSFLKLDLKQEIVFPLLWTYLLGEEKLSSQGIVQSLLSLLSSAEVVFAGVAMSSKWASRWYSPSHIYGVFVEYGLPCLRLVPLPTALHE